MPKATSNKPRRPPAKPPGIRDVARVAGVSMTTVSHALSGKGRVPAATRDRVRGIAEDLGYRPNPNARNLAGQRSGVLALAIPAFEGTLVGSDLGFYLRVLAGASQSALQHGSVLAVATATGDEGGFSAQIPFDGAIVADPVPDDPRLKPFRSGRTPVVTIGRLPGAEDEYPWVDNDHSAAVRMVLDELAALGAERPALMSLDEASGASSYYSDVLEGYESWCGDHGVRPVVARSTPGDPKSARGSARRLLRRKRPPDAVHAVADELARALDIVARERGMDIPKDLLASCLSVSLASDRELPLLRIELNSEEQGRRAAESLAALIEGRDVVENVVVATGLRNDAL